METIKALGILGYGTCTHFSLYAIRSAHPLLFSGINQLVGFRVLCGVLVCLCVTEQVAAVKLSFQFLPTISAVITNWTTSGFFSDVHELLNIARAHVDGQKVDSLMKNMPDRISPKARTVMHPVPKLGIGSIHHAGPGNDRPLVACWP